MEDGGNWNSTAKRERERERYANVPVVGLSVWALTLISLEAEVKLSLDYYVCFTQILFITQSNSNAEDKDYKIWCGCGYNTTWLLAAKNSLLFQP